MDDYRAIATVVNLFALHADGRRWKDLADLFTPSVVVDYTSLAGGTPSIVDAATLVAGWRKVLGNLTMTQHMVSNQVVEVDHTRATCQAYFQATHLLRDEALAGKDMWTLGGRYEFGLVQDASAWKIERIRMTAMWQTGNADIMRIARERPEI